jgi:single-strand DNA-binding protein
MNTIQLTGRLVADPAYKELADNQHVTELRLAVEGMGRGARDRAGYINVTSWVMSQRAADTLAKGWLVAVEGRLQHEVYEKDGEKRSAYRVIGHVEFLSRPRGDQENGATPAEEDVPVGVSADEDIPF